MPLYDFRCPACGDFELFQPITATTRVTYCPRCGHFSRKVLAPPAIKTSMPEHFNAALGSYVSSEAEYRDGLKEASEKASQRAGYDMNFTPVDLHDRAALGVTDEGLDATHRRRVAQGREDVTKHF